MGKGLHCVIRVIYTHDIARTLVAALCDPRGLSLRTSGRQGVHGTGDRGLRTRGGTSFLHHLEARFPEPYGTRSCQLLGAARCRHSADARAMLALARCQVRRKETLMRNQARSCKS